MKWRVWERDGENPISEIVQKCVGAALAARLSWLTGGRWRTEPIVFRNAVSKRKVAFVCMLSGWQNVVSTVCLSKVCALNRHRMFGAWAVQTFSHQQQKK